MNGEPTRKTGPTIQEIVAFIKTTKAYQEAVERDNETVHERMRRSPLLRALADRRPVRLQITLPDDYTR